MTRSFYFLSAATLCAWTAGIFSPEPARSATVELVSQSGGLARGAVLSASGNGRSSVSGNGRYILTAIPVIGPYHQVAGVVYDRLSGQAVTCCYSLSSTGAHLSADGRFGAYNYYSPFFPMPSASGSFFETAVGSSVGGSNGLGISISPGGRFATSGLNFASAGVYLVDRLAPNVPGVFIAPAAAYTAALSFDGGTAAFFTPTDGLAPGISDANGTNDVFLWDWSTRAITLVSRRAGSSSAADRASTDVRVSWDGRAVLFHSEAGDLIPGQVDSGTRQLFFYDRGSGQISQVSHIPGSAVTSVSAPVSNALISANGRFAVWISSATDAVAGQTGPAVSQIFLSDLTNGETVLASRAAASPTQGGNAPSTLPGLSGDGRYVSFQSTATDLVPGQIDTEDTPDVFLFDRVTSTTVLASRSAGSAATAANGASTRPEISLDGTTVVFNSLATDLAPGDLNSQEDVYAFRRDATPGGFFTLPPCRLLDTREAGQGPALASGDLVVRTLNGRCPIPWTAKALSVNATVIPEQTGYVSLFPGDLTTPPEISTVNFRAGRVKANNAVLTLSRNGEGSFAVRAAMGAGGNVHLVIDVNGYFE